MATSHRTTATFPSSKISTLKPQLSTVKVKGLWCTIKHFLHACTPKYWICMSLWFDLLTWLVLWFCFVCMFWLTFFMHVFSVHVLSLTWVWTFYFGLFWWLIFVFEHDLGKKKKRFFFSFISFVFCVLGFYFALKFVFGFVKVCL